jgi:L-lactate dehydrogenase
VVVCAGANQQPGETRLDLLKKNLAIFNGLIPQIVAVNSDAVILIATNPVDILTYATARQIVGDPRRVIGSGTLLDTARFRYNLGAHYNVDARSVHAYIVGEHGDSEIPLWSSADIGSVPLRQFVGPNGQGYDEAQLNQLFARTRDAAYEIIKRKKATYYAIGLGLLTIVEAILRDQHSVLTVSSLMSNQHGVSDVALSLSTIVGRGGVTQVLDAPMTAIEADGFRHSADVLKSNWQKLGGV